MAYLKQFIFIMILSFLVTANAEFPDSFVEEKELDLEAGFREPPQTAKSLVFWHWINGYVTQKGITEDLEDMKRAGLGGVQLFDGSMYSLKGPVRYSSEQWNDCVQHAITECDRLGLEFCMMNCAGWATSGGPWITPEQSMKEIVWSETEVVGPGKFEGKLTKSENEFGFYRDIAVFAVPSDASEAKEAKIQIQDVRSGTQIENLRNLIDGKEMTVVEFPEAPVESQSGTEINNLKRFIDALEMTINEFPAAPVESPHYVEFCYKKPVKRRLLTMNLLSQSSRLVFGGYIEVSQDGKSYKKIRDFNYRGDSSLATVITIPFEQTRGQFFRIWFGGTANSKPIKCKFSEISLSNQYRIENYYSKTCKVATTLNRPKVPFDMVDKLAIPRDKVISLSHLMEPDGQITCDIPQGEWTLLRFGYVSTGRTNHPAQPEGKGLEIDKLDADAVEFHVEKALGKIIERSKDASLKSFKGIIVDSFEAGFQNWTQDFPEEFQKRQGYDMLEWLPVVTGRVVGSLGLSECFLWDFRYTVGQLIAESYYGTVQDYAHQHGMQFYAEPYDGMASTFQCGDYIDVPTAEFWLHPKNYVKMIASISHTFGQPLVAAEAYTALPEDGAWRTYPALLKPYGDRAFTQGLNKTVLHSYVHQPIAGAMPGFTLGRYGSHFGRLNTWWKYAPAWLGYISRCQFLLQQGNSVADICLLFHNDLDKTVKFEVPKLPQGIDYDVCAPKAFLRLEYKNGVLSFPHGTEYKLIVLPNDAFMSLDVLRHIYTLVQSGAVITGPPPVGLSGLGDYINSKEEFNKLVSKLWGDIDGQSNMSAKVGRGKVYYGATIEQILKDNQVESDFSYQSSLPEADICYTHRKSKDADIYFISNLGQKKASITGQFRVVGKQPEFWDAVTGNMWDASVFNVADNQTSVELTLEPAESIFVIFRKPLLKKWITSIKADSVVQLNGMLLANKKGQVTSHYSDGTTQTIQVGQPSEPVEVAGAWQVKFLDGRGAPPEIKLETLISWTEHSDTGVR